MLDCMELMYFRITWITMKTKTKGREVFMFKTENALPTVLIGKKSHKG